MNTLKKKKKKKKALQNLGLSYLSYFFYNWRTPASQCSSHTGLTFHINIHKNKYTLLSSFHHYPSELLFFFLQEILYYPIRWSQILYHAFSRTVQLSITALNCNNCNFRYLDVIMSLVSLSFRLYGLKT